MKGINEYLIKESTDEVELVVLTPEELKKVLEFVKGNEDKGLCLRSTQNTDDEWYQIDACYYDERGNKGPRNWPWKKISNNKIIWKGV